jgi:hypothetical protein
MRIRMRLIPVLALIAMIFPPTLSGEGPVPSPAQLRRNLLELNKNLPWRPANGYAMEARFVLKVTGEDLEYSARYARAPGRWAADFSHENRSCNVRYVLSGEQAWIASPEITIDTAPIRLPYMARYDFFTLYDEFLRILQKGKQDPRFSLEAEDNLIQVRGTLQNGWEAAYILSDAQYFPRQVRITMVREPSPSWLFAFAEPDGSGYSSEPSGQMTEFEIWFSDPVEADGYRYARRMDFAERGNVIGTFFLEKIASGPAIDDLFKHPPRFPWAEQANFSPRTQWPESSFYMDASELAALRGRIEEEPWAGWNKKSGWIAFWANLALRISPIIPGTPTFKTVTMTVAIGFLGFVFLLVRRRNQLHRKFSWKLFAAGVFAGCFILVAENASLQIHNSDNRSLFALHSALRYAVTGDPSYAETAKDLLEGFAQAPARSMEELGRSCQAYALAYDLVLPELPYRQRTVMEKQLFEYARPLFGAARGWSSNINGSSTLAAGLGMIGLALGHEPFIGSAEKAIRKTLETQLTGGLYREGPGQGGIAMDSAVNLFYGLKHSKRTDYYRHPSFREYIQATLRMLSPVGTLPLFGDTNLDQPAGLSMFFIKTANQLTEEEERRCMAAYQRYWDYGQYRANGWMRRMLPALQPAATYYENPYALLQYTRSIAPGSLPSSSAVLGNGQAGILRTGSAPDDLYLALNAPKSNPDDSRRDILTFDFYAYRSLLLHGAGFPGKSHSRYREIQQTALSNSVTLNNESQPGTRSSGIEASLLNRPVFDYIRASADKTYDYGQVQRDVIMVRPEKDHPAYFLLVDAIRVGNPATPVQWRLHGSEDLASGVGQTARWTGVPFSPARWRPGRVNLEVTFPTGFMGYQTTESGTLYSRTPSLNRKSKGLTIEWIGSRRFVTMLYPYNAGTVPEIQALGPNSGRIGETDWVSTGNLDSRLTAGPLVHTSELTVVRDRTRHFPALLMISGIEFQLDIHSLSSTKPLTVSLDGLRGGLVNSRPDTRVDIHSPEIETGDAFLLDGQPVFAHQPGSLMLQLQDPGEHNFRRAP